MFHILYLRSWPVQKSHKKDFWFWLRWNSPIVPRHCLITENSGHNTADKHQKAQKGGKKANCLGTLGPEEWQDSEFPGFLTGSHYIPAGCCRSLQTPDLQQAQTEKQKQKQKSSKKSLFHLVQGPEIHGLTTKILIGNTLLWSNTSSKKCTTHCKNSEAEQETNLLPALPLPSRNQTAALQFSSPVVRV